MHVDPDPWGAASLAPVGGRPEERALVEEGLEGSEESFRVRHPVPSDLPLYHIEEIASPAPQDMGEDG